LQNIKDIIHNPYCDNRFVNLMDISSVEVIFEVGMYDGLYTQKIIETFENCKKLFGFECNPDRVEVCKGNIKNLTNVIFNNVALNNDNSKLKFYPCRRGRQAASSLYRLTDQSDKQDMVIVDGITLDTYCHQNNISRIDLICLDVEGAEMRVLLGGEKMLLSTKYIIAEVSNVDRYIEKIPLREEVRGFLYKKGFEEKFYYGSHIENGDPFGDALYVNKFL